MPVRLGQHLIPMMHELGDSYLMRAGSGTVRMGVAKGVAPLTQESDFEAFGSSVALMVSGSAVAAGFSVFGQSAASFASGASIAAPFAVAGSSVAAVQSGASLQSGFAVSGGSSAIMIVVSDGASFSVEGASVADVISGASVRSEFAVSGSGAASMASGSDLRAEFAVSGASVAAVQSASAVGASFAVSGSSVADMTGANESSVQFLLDIAAGSGSIGAWSLRALSSSTTAVVRVRRGSDNAHLDFTASEVVDGDLAAWVGAGVDGFVTTLYDQAGANDLAQTVALEQPIIVSSGVVVLENGLPALDFGGGRYLTLGVGNSLDYSGGYLNVFSVNQNPDAGVADRLVADDIVGTQGYFLIRPKFSLAITINDGTGYKSGGSPVVYTSQGLLSLLFEESSGAGEYFLDGAAQGGFTLSPWDGSIGSSGTAGFAMGSGGNGGQTWRGTQQELVVFGVDKASDRAAIEQNIADHYGISI